MRHRKTTAQPLGDSAQRAARRGPARSEWTILTVALALALQSCGYPNSAPESPSDDGASVTPDASSSLVPTCNDALSTALAMIVQRVPHGSERFAAHPRALAEQGGTLRAERAVLRHADESWLGVSFSPGLARYAFRESPRIWIEVNDPDPHAAESGYALRYAASGDVRELTRVETRRAEQFVIARAPADLPRTSFDVHIGPGITSTLVNDVGDVELRDEGGIARLVIEHPVAYDANGHEFVGSWSLIGSATTFTRIDMTLPLDGALYPLVLDPTVSVPTWTLKTPTAKPPGLDGHAMTFDAKRGVVVLFGGRKTGNICFSDTWEWNGTTWANVSPVAGPTARYMPTLVYDATLQESVLYAGHKDCAGASGTTTYAWDGTSWSTPTATNPPPGWRYSAGGTYDTTRARLILFGNSYIPENEVYEYQANVGWTNPQPSTRPANRGAPVLFFDTVTTRAIIFSGTNGAADTWGWNGVNWLQYTASGAPVARDQAASVFDTDRAVGVLFGGHLPNGCCTYYSDTYEWYGQDWHYVSTSSSPGALSNGAMAYDSVRQEAVFFGGQGNSTQQDKTWTYKILQQKTSGEACQAATDCLSGYCVDGVCCSNACGNGVVTDCQACSVATGAPSDGTCGVVTVGATVCRPSAGVCDAPELCDGVSTACPSNKYQPNTVGCRAAVDACDAPESCTGTAATCPPDVVASAGTLCRSTAGPCDVPETCDGVAIVCPIEAYRPSGYACRVAVDLCDAVEACTGSDPLCPVDLFKSAGVPCRVAAGVCDIAETCTGASTACPVDQFVSAATVCRSAAGPCDQDEYCPGSGSLCPADAFATDGTQCTDGSACTVGDGCQGGVCVAGTAKTCAALDSCHLAGTCNPGTGVCSNPARADGASCDDGDACTELDTCASGSCAGVVRNCADTDSCTVDTCDHATGCVHAEITGCADAGADAPVDASEDVIADVAAEDALPDIVGDVVTDVFEGGVVDADAGSDADASDARVDAQSSVDAGDDAVVEPTPEAGPDATPGAAVDATGVPPAASGCGCRTAPVDRDARPETWIMVSVLAAFARRRRRTPTRGRESVV